MFDRRPHADEDRMLQSLMERLQVLEEYHAEQVKNEQPLNAAGTWTPFFSGNGTAGVFTYTTQIGVYRRRGPLVWFSGRLLISAIGTPPTGILYIGGLPIAAIGTHYSPVTFGYIHNFNYAANSVQLTGVIGGTIIEMYETFDNASVAAAPAANFTNAGCGMIFGGVYAVN